MGLQIYKVYRRKGWYYRIDVPCDDSPRVLGATVLNEVARGDGYQKWLEGFRDSLDKELEQLRMEADDPEGKLDEYGDEEMGSAIFISRQRPRNDLWQWIFEIDTDNEIFHVDGHPLFNLQDIPPTNLFLRCIGYDSYGHCAHTETTPIRYRYTSRKISYPPASKELVEVYQSKHASGDIVTSLRHFDVILENPAKCEMVRLHFYQALIGSILKFRDAGSIIRNFELDADPKPLKEIQKLTMYLVQVAVEKRITEVEVELKYIPVPTKNSSWRWLREDLCVLWATRLDNEANMQAAIADLFTRVTQAPPKAKTIVYGIVISLFHVVIVRVDLSVSKSEGSFKHTAALQFLPSFYAQSPSTLGITAVIRLGYALLCHDLDNLLYSPTYFGEHRHPASVVGKVPVEIWSLIAEMLYQPAYLDRLSLLSRQSKFAVERLLLYPLLASDRWFGQPPFRLVGSAETNVPNATQVAQGRDMVHEEVIELEESEEEYDYQNDYDDDDIPDYWDLYSAAFKIDSARGLGAERLQLPLPSPSDTFDIICHIHDDVVAFNDTFRRY
ncbi:hypothetical protein BDZ97DRAFT_2061111 [Flammula alnicola]|nr:hypothetical protein BDZ97DRAFT_2061111 [Flammula alnicola]